MAVFRENKNPTRFSRGECQENEVIYKDKYIIRWTGLKGNMATSELAGQFIVRPINSKQDYKYPWVYSSTGGHVGTFSTSVVFNCSHIPGEPFIGVYSSENDKVHCVERAYVRLEDFMKEKVLKVEWESKKKYELKERELLSLLSVTRALNFGLFFVHQSFCRRCTYVATWLASGDNLAVSSASFLAVSLQLPMSLRY